MTRGTDDAALFVPGNRCSSAAEIRVRTVANFNQCERSAIEHDKIDFTATAAIVSLDQLQLAGGQKFERCVFTADAELFSMLVVHDLCLRTLRRGVSITGCLVGYGCRRS